MRESCRAKDRKGSFQTGPKRHTTDQIMVKLCPADVLLGESTKVPELYKRLEVTTGIFSEKISWDGIYTIGGCQWGKGAPVVTSF